MTTSKRHTLATIASLLLALGMATATVLGPLLRGDITFHVSDSARLQLLGTELVSLALAAPVALVAAILWWRNHRVAPAIAVLPAGYAVYVYTQYIVGPQYDRYPGNNEYFFPLYFALVILGMAIVRHAWTALRTARVAPPAPAVRYTLAGLLLAFSVVIAAAWIQSIAVVLSGTTRGTTLIAYRADPTLFWVVRLMDLALVLPAAAVAGGALLRGAGARHGRPFALAVTGIGILLGAAVANMALFLLLFNDVSANLVFLIVIVTWTIVTAILYVVWLVDLARRLGARSAPEHRETR